MDQCRIRHVPNSLADHLGRNAGRQDFRGQKPVSVSVGQLLVKNGTRRAAHSLTRLRLEPGGVPMRNYTCRR